MENGKRSENITGVKENGESKIPKSATFPSVKETSSKAPVQKKAVQSSKTTTKIATVTSTKLKQTHITNLPKKGKRMSVAKISKDVMSHFHDENLKSDDHSPEPAAGINVPAEENETKRAPLKEKFSQTSQKQTRSLPKKSSASDLKACTAFGGIRFTAKRNSCRKFDMFQKMTKVSKDNQVVNTTESCTKEMKTADSATAIAIKAIESSNGENLDVPSTTKSERLKALPLPAKETALKKSTAFGGMRFTPKWQSTPLKPELFDNKQKVSKQKAMYPSDSSAKRPEKIQNPTKAITKDETITIDETIIIDETITLDETVQPPTIESKLSKRPSITVKEISDRLYPAFAGMRLTPKRKSTHPKPDIFERGQEESKVDYQESHHSGTSEQIKKSSCDTEVKTETQLSHVEKLEKTSTQMARFSETVSITVKETSHAAAFGGIHFAPKYKSTPIRPDMFESIQKEPKANRLESHPTDSSTKELKKIAASTTARINVQPSDVEKLELLKTQKLKSSKTEDASKNMKKVIPPAFGGLRFKPRQKNLHDVFEIQKSKVNNKM